VDLTPPSLQPGMAGVEALLAANALAFVDDIRVRVEEGARKPRLFEAFAMATGIASAVPSASHEAASGFSLAVGSAAAVHASSFGPEMLAALEGIGLEGDLEAGACAEPMVLRARYRFPSGAVDLALGLGYFDAVIQGYGAESLMGDASCGYRIGAPGSGALAWEALRLETGCSLAINTLSGSFRTGPISQTVPIDPDASGPLVPIYATISVDPPILLAMESRVLNARLQASTGFSLLGALSLSLGAGGVLTWGGSALSLDTEAPIEVQGYLEGLVDQPGRISISGTAASYPYLGVSPYASAALSFTVGAFSLSLPLVYGYPGGLGAGLFAQVKYR